MPAAFSTTLGEAAVDRWWEAFGSDELNALVEQALAESPTLTQAWARLEQARATARQQGADLYPSLTGEASAGHSRSRVNGNRRHGDEFALGLAASYEVDLWGRVRSRRDAAALTAEAGRQDLEAAATTVAAAVTSTWLGVLANRADRAVLDEQLKSNQTYLELLDLRFRKSMATALDVDQQRQLVASVQGEAPLVEANGKAFEYRLAVLLGKPATTNLGLSGVELPDLPPLPAGGVPADLLANRPDVKAALARLRAADKGVIVARADRLPAIRLTGSGALRNDAVEDIFEDWYVNLLAGLTAPIFDGNRRKGEVVRTRAVVKERLAAYHETVLNAVREVEEALLRETKQQENMISLRDQILYARRVYEQANARYTRGQVDFLRVLTAQASRQSLDRKLIAAQLALLGYRLDLYRALGGAWTRDLTHSGEASPAEAKETK